MNVQLSTRADRRSKAELAAGGKKVRETEENACGGRRSEDVVASGGPLPALDSGAIRN